jgi:outer membrane protein OmpA-like peptidoglycan-associated protein
MSTFRASSRVLAAALCGLAALAGATASGEGPQAPQAAEAAAERPSCLGKARLRGELFEEDSAVPKPAVLPMLDVVASAVTERCAGKPILIEGHTEASGDAAADQRISEARAAEVKRLLVERGVPEPLRTEGFGSSRPLTTDRALAGINRRVTFVVEGE